MHRFESKRQEGIREDITNLQRSRMEEVFQNLQQNLDDSRQRDNPRSLVLNLGRELEKVGIREEMFAKFIENDSKAGFTLMLRQIRKEWVGALDNSEDLGRVASARDGIKKKADALESMAKNGREILAVAYCLKDASGEGGVREAFSKMSGPEARMLFRRAEKEAEEHLEGLLKKEISGVFRKIALGEEYDNSPS